MDLRFVWLAEPYTRTSKPFTVPGQVSPSPIHVSLRVKTEDTLFTPCERGGAGERVEIPEKIVISGPKHPRRLRVVRGLGFGLERGNVDDLALGVSRIGFGIRPLEALAAHLVGVPSVVADTLEAW